MTKTEDPILSIAAILKLASSLNQNLDCPSLARACLELQNALAAHPAQTHEGGLIQLSIALAELESLLMTNTDAALTRSIKTCISLIDSSLVAIQNPIASPPKKLATALISH